MSGKTVTNVPYQLFSLALCFLVIGLLVFDTTWTLNEETKTLLAWTDYALCALFFVDFIYLLITAENRKKYLMTWGLIDLVSCIPTFGWGRIARLVRILRLLKAIHSSKKLFDAIYQRKGESALLMAALLLIFGTLFGSVAIMQCELHEPDTTITNASDAVWWTFCMILKSGCDNIAPVTIEGRCVAAVLIFLCMVINGTVIGFAAMLLTSNRNNSEKESIEL